MKDFYIIQKLIGGDVSESALEHTDYYVRPQLGIFIPNFSDNQFTTKALTVCPSYMIIIYFEQLNEKRAHYRAEIVSPNVPYKNIDGIHYYCILIDRSYFEKRYLMYSNDVPKLLNSSFQICADILKALNTFVFEYSKSMPNSHITLDAQAEIITHWIIRSIMGETLDLRAVSSDYSVARAQHYIEQHYFENITVSGLAALGHVSTSCFNRRFKKEMGVTPFEYLIEIRIERAKVMLKRKNISITEIALRCGFSSTAHFSSCFQNRLGIAPSEFRDKYTN